MTYNLNDYPLWTALVTPLLEDGTLDRDSFVNLCREQEEAKNGLLLLGSTGEALNMTAAMKKEILDLAMGLDLKVPLMVGVGGQQFEETKAWVEYLNTLPLSAILVVCPLYAKPEREGQYLWFKGLMDVTNHQVMLYNVPGRTAKVIFPSVIERLKDHPRFWALKEASGSVERYGEFRKATPYGALMSGDDGMLPQFCEVGCQGLVSVASNAWPKETHLYVQKALAKTLSKEEADLWDACAAALFCVSNPIPVKRLMAEDKRLKTPNLLLPLHHKDLAQAATLLEADRRIKDWYQQNKKGK